LDENILNLEYLLIVLLINVTTYLSEFFYQEVFQYKNYYVLV